MFHSSRLALVMFSCCNKCVLQQKTLRQPAYLSGIGLHSGNRVNLAILPAPADVGIVFRRTDLEGKPEVEAKIENVIA